MGGGRCLACGPHLLCVTTEPAANAQRQTTEEPSDATALFHSNLNPSSYMLVLPSSPGHGRHAISTYLSPWEPVRCVTGALMLPAPWARSTLSAQTVSGSCPKAGPVHQLLPPHHVFSRWSRASQSLAEPHCLSVLFVMGCPGTKCPWGGERPVCASPQLLGDRAGVRGLRVRLFCHLLRHQRVKQAGGTWAGCEADITDRDGYRAGHEGPWYLSPS